VVAGGQLVFKRRGVDLDRLQRTGRRLAQALRAGDLVLLYGPLGAGKTTFVRVLAKALGVIDTVRSPSFTIANVYSGRTALQHLDLYRLDEIGDDDALALEEYVGKGAITIVEWPEAGLGRLGQPTWIVRLDHESLSERTVAIEAVTEDARSRWERARE
jgi:tRNA threonylcarbamoyladenosine biosynthesis protein TsaE